MIEQRWHVYVADGINVADLNLRKTLWAPTQEQARERAERVGYRVLWVELAPPASM